MSEGRNGGSRAEVREGSVFVGVRDGDNERSGRVEW